MNDADKEKILEDLINEYTDNINNGKYWAIYNDEAVHEAQLEPNLTRLLYNNGINPLDDEDFNNVPAYFAYGIDDVSNFHEISHKLIGDVPKIKARAFSNCKNVEVVDVSCDIEDAAFEGCVNLKTVKLGSDINYTDERIGDEAFIGCTSLEKVHIGKSVSKIWDNCFTGCTNLKTVEFEDRGKNDDKIYLKDDLFAYCPNLTEITLPLRCCLSDSTFRHSNIKKINMYKLTHEWNDYYIPNRIEINFID